jgi:hypothetical protein
MRTRPGALGNGRAGERGEEKWPVAFPVKDQDVRPLAIGAVSEIATAMGWLLPYTLGVLGRWKMASVYCQAVLCHDQRITNPGAPAEPVGAEAKDMAGKQLARLAARKGAKKPAKATAPAAAKATPAFAPPIEITQAAGAIAEPGACRALAPERIAGAADQLPLPRPAQRWRG